MDLFDALTDAPTYPDHPGFKARETAEAAADAIAPKAPLLREKCLEALACGDFTADECAKFLRVDKLSIRPRFSELATAGQIVDSGLRRLNSSHRSAIVWTLARRAP